MKVLHVLDHSVPLFSGYSFRSQSIIREQVALGLSPVVLTSPKHGSQRDEIDEIESVRYYRTKVPTDHFIGGRGLPFIKEVLVIRQLAARIRKVIEIEKVELIHSHSPSLNGLASLWMASRLRLPFLYEARAFWEDAAVSHGTFSEQSIRYRISRLIETFVFIRANRVVTICEGMRNDLLSRKVAADRVSIVPNGVDVGWFLPCAAAEDLIEKFRFKGKPVFGFIGSFYRYEGLRFLISAVPELLRRLPDAKVIMVGGGYDERFLKEMAKPYAESIIFTGQVPHERIKDYYSILDVFVCPREKIRLTELVTPLKPLEAMSMGKTVLASDVGGHLELIENNRTGLLFKAEDRDDFVTQAVRAMSDANLRRTIGRQARCYVEAERSWPRIVLRYLDVYRQLLEDGNDFRQTWALDR